MIEYKTDIPIDISPFSGADQSRRYLVTAGGGRYLVSHRFALVLKALTERPQTASQIRTAVAFASGEDFDAQPFLHRIPPGWTSHVQAPRHASVPLFWHRDLLAPESVRKIAKCFTFLFSPVSVIIVGAAVAASVSDIVAQVSQIGHGSVGLPYVVTIALALFVGVIFHEIGHASATLRFGAAPGSIGIGLYLFYPSMFTDVSDAWRLKPLQRVSVDVAGIYFQIIFLLAISLLHRTNSAMWLSWITYLTLISLGQTLNPFLKMDAYWILTDAVGIPNLHLRARDLCASVLGGREGGIKGTRKRKGALVAAYVLSGALLAVSLSPFMLRGLWVSLCAIAHYCSELVVDIRFGNLSQAYADAHAMLATNGSLFITVLLLVAFGAARLLSRKPTLAGK